MVLGEEKALALANQHNIAIYLLLYEQDTFKAAHSESFHLFLQE